MKSAIAAAAILAALTSFAHADPGSAGRGDGRDSDADQAKHRLNDASADFLFDRFDIDGDGVITRKEVEIVFEQRDRERVVQQDQKRSPDRVTRREETTNQASPRRTDCFSRS